MSEMDVETLLLDVKKLGERVSALKDSIATEEATKTSLIMPFFQLLGYDVFNPLEFSPEYIADVGIKKGEKVDYAILNNGNPIILIEAKSIKENLKNHDSQLFRYFGTTTAKFGILTNGNEYRFYTDLEEPNKMDKTPFFSFVLTEIKDVQISEIFKFQKENFDVENISKAASDLKYLNFVKEFLTKEVNDPSEEFVKFILGEIYDGIKTKVIIDKFTPVVKRGFRQFIADQVNSKLNAALNTSVSVEEVNVEPIIEEKEVEEKVITTESEIEAFTTTKLLLKDTIDTSRIFYRDNKSYFNIMVDNSIRKWILRLYINNSRTFFVINDEEKTTIEIVDVIDIFNYADKIIPVVERYI
ncbi:type I restriction endonuclease [Listeria ivanovii]|nr:type I restriction endonuclease [Listeria ivanovii]MBC1760734.1 endonuclease [Listeria ivanovii]MBC2256190.1 endonuclease [Listeria ivanovii]MCJ1718466.1 type I restriction endonuclease [Listeria ivanovii]MCJ1723655.1 type I restriction endonuclease [Listeria ivanovii]MCJ1736373.1 type I restriction endonuclease [Listeria ivanovii]